MKIERMEDFNSMLTGVSCLRGEFTERKKILNVSKELVSEGEILVVRGVGVVLRQIQPLSKITVLGHSGVFENDVRIASFPESMQNTLLALFSLQTEQLASSFGAEIIKTGDLYALAFSPTASSLSSVISSVRIVGTCYPKELSVTKKNGEEITYMLSGIQWSPFSLSDTEVSALQVASVTS